MTRRHATASHTIIVNKSDCYRENTLIDRRSVETPREVTVTHCICMSRNFMVHFLSAFFTPRATWREYLCKIHTTLQLLPCWAVWWFSDDASPSMKEGARSFDGSRHECNADVLDWNLEERERGLLDPRSGILTNRFLVFHVNGRSCWNANLSGATYYEFNTNG